MIEPNENDIGRMVSFQRLDGDQIITEYGVITSINDFYIFVQWGQDTHSKATSRMNLNWASAG